MTYKIAEETVALCRDCEAHIQEPLYVAGGDFEPEDYPVCPYCYSGRLWFLRQKEDKDNA